MAPVSTHPSSSYSTVLSQKIEKKLQRALISPSQTRDLLQELFADIALEVDDRAKEIIFSSEDVISTTEERIEGPICYYDVLAEHFIMVPHNGRVILDSIDQLWSQSFASNIFTLLFHKWLFEVECENSKVLLRYSSALIQGASNVFWIDIQTNTRRFQSLFRYLLEEVALVPDRLKKIPLEAQRSLFLLLSRFLIFYDSVEKLESFLKQLPDYQNAFLIGGPADIFVTELADQLQKLKVEPVLLYYLSQMKVLSGLQLRMTTSTRLKTCLYSFTSPGAPMYPTRAVRHAAWDALNLLFPVGMYPRHLISIFFRLLYPWYWPASCWNFIKACIIAAFYSILRLILSSWERLRKPKER